MQTTVDGLKGKLTTHVGSSPSAMMLELRDRKGITVAKLTDPSRKLGYYSPEDGFILHVHDIDPTSCTADGWLEDTSKVQKYVMADEEYEKRENTYRKYKQAKLAADPTWTIEKEMAKKEGRDLPPLAEKVTDPEYLAAEAASMSVGDRCQVKLGGTRGTVRFVGTVEQLPPGYWIGIEYDEPAGKHDGLIRGQRYFQCPMGHGAFLRPDKLEVGDFPEIDLLGSDDEL
jgi:tubulin-specific chaperone B